MRIYKLLSVLFDYPHEEIHENIPAIRALLDDSGLDQQESESLARFLDWLEMTDPLEVQRQYVDTFDLRPEHSLHLTHHLFGDDKNRGPALIDMAEYYRSWGLEPVEGELPDYLPLMLEFGSTLEAEEARIFLSHVHKLLAVLASNLEESKSPWAPLARIVENRSALARQAA
ncbi:MAG: hypothetical protein Kow006_09220 [Gammaproteobacteria bacterium]